MCKKKQSEIKISLWKKGITQEQIARELNYTQPFISMIISGKKKPTKKFVEWFNEKVKGNTMKEENTACNKVEDGWSLPLKIFKCNYSISEIIKTENNQEQIYERIIKLIPHAFIYPGFICSRLIIDTKEFKTENFKETPWKLSRDIRLNGNKIGILEVFSKEAKPFLDLEKELLDIISERIEGIKLQELLREGEHTARINEKRFLTLFEYSPISIWEEDFSMVKEYFNKLYNRGVRDFRKYFEAHREEVLYLSSLVRILNVNKKTLEFFEVESKDEFISNLLNHFTDEALDVFKEEMITLAEGKTEFKAEVPLKTLSGAIKIVFIYLSVVPGCEETFSRVIVSFVDITEQKLAEKDKERLQKQIYENQKMISIGTLTGGIAHNFNNILGAIMGYTELTMLDITKHNVPYEYLNKVIRSCERGRNLIKQLLAFSGKSMQEKHPLILKNVVKEALGLIRSSVPSNIKIIQNIEDNLSVILADRTQINQLIVDLCINASQAINEDSGTIDISLGDIKLKPEDLSYFSDLKTGPYVELIVKDNGHGMSPDTLKHIFDPFFTTKDVGEGLGLGLSAIRGIVKQHNGDIKVYSEPWKGTAFHIFFPKISVPEDLPVLKEKKERILLVDDEKMLVDLFENILKRLGYSVFPTTSCLEGMEVFSKEPDKFDLIITDQAMPEMTGKELARRCLNIRPDIPVILCTGFSENIDSVKALKIGIKAFIMKPVNVTTIETTIRNVLNQ